MAEPVETNDELFELTDPEPELEPEPELNDLFEPLADPEPDALFELTEPDTDLDTAVDDDTAADDLVFELEPESELEEAAELVEVAEPVETNDELFELATPFDEVTEITNDFPTDFASDDLQSDNFYVDDDPLVFSLDESTSSQVDAAHEASFGDTPLAESAENPFTITENPSDGAEDGGFEAEPNDQHTLSEELPEGETLVLDFAELGLLPPVDTADAEGLPADPFARTDDATEATSDLGFPMIGDSGSLLDEPSTANWADELSFEPVEPPEPFTAPGIDLFDVNTGSDELEGQKIDLSDVAETTDFDAVAAADEIETELDDLGAELNEPQLASNVIPIRPDLETDNDAPHEGDEDHPQATTGKGSLRPNETGWVTMPAGETQEEADPWAHMRPTEEPKKKSFWSMRPKFFGGDKRRRRRREIAVSPEEKLDKIDEAVGISFDKECPNCGTECEVDLDDPVGRRVHVSCPSCSHLWHTPYLIEDQSDVG